MSASGRRDDRAEISGIAVPLPGPLDVAMSLEPMGRWGDDMLDRWDGRRLVRTLRLCTGAVAYTCTVEGTIAEPVLRLYVDRPGAVDAVVVALRATFLQPPGDFATLCRGDAIVGRLAARYPGLRPLRYHDLLHALIRSISAQQVNLAWAATTRRRLAEAFGEPRTVAGETVYVFDAERLAAASVADVRALQFTTRKAEYIVGIAQEIASGRLDLAALDALPDDEVVERLTALRGIGLWTAEWLLTRTLGRPRVVAGDLGVRKAVGRAYFDGALPSEADVRAATAHWGASAAVAQALLLHDLAAGPSAGPPLSP